MKLKRILISVLSLLMLASVALFAACKSEQEGELVEISYLSGLPASVWVDKTPDCSSLKIYAVYDNGTSKEIIYDAKTFTVTVDTTAVNPEAKVVIAYGGKECKTTVSVIEYQIAGVDIPSFAAKYNGTTAENSSSTFIDKTQGYVVGNVNPFYFSPVVIGYDENDEQIKEYSVAINADVYFYRNDEEVVIDNPSDYYTLDGETAAFSFTSAAADKTFLIRVCPQSLTEAQLEEKDKYSIDFKVTVKDKFYNVYNALDLLAFDNRVEANRDVDKTFGQAIYDFRAEKGMDNESVKGLKGLAVHGDITLTKDDFPADYFWQESELSGVSELNKSIVVGSLKDSRYIGDRSQNTYLMYRDLGKNGEFSIEGNYFTVDASGIPYIAIEKETDASDEIHTESVISHTKLFYVLGDSHTDETEYTEQANFNNLSFIGNLNRNEADYSGGLICLESNGAKTNIYNNIANSWYITTFSSQNATGHGVTVEKSIYEDDYNCIFYVWGGILNVKDSIVRRAGGPVVIADHVGNEPDDEGGRVGGSGGWIPVLTFDDYTSANMYSHVTGQESWFQQMKANKESETIALLLEGITQISSNFSHSYINKVTENGTEKTLMNLLVIFKDSGSTSFTTLCEYSFSGKATLGTHSLDYENSNVKDALADDTIKGYGIPLIYSKSSETITGMGMVGSSTMYYALKDSKMEPVSSAYELPILTNATQGQGFGSFLNLFYRPAGKNGALGLIFGDFSAEA